MSRRRIGSGRAKDVARERIDILMRLAVSETKAGNKERARRYVFIARRIGMKTKVPMPADTRYCKHCGIPLVPGITSRVRLRDGRVTIRCLECAEFKRIPYIREQRNDGKGS